MGEGIECSFGGGDHFDIEALEQGTGAKYRPRQFLSDSVEIIIRRFGLQPAVQAEDLAECMIQPKP